MTPLTLNRAALMVAAVLACHGAQAAVSAEEAARLKTDLTPLGGERAGNKDGSIPAWTGGLTGAPPVTADARRPDPYAGEKPLFSITAKNLAQYEGKLAEGTKALLKRYPDSYRLDVYKTHRTAAAPQWVYDNTAKNAVRASLVDGGAGPMPKGAFAGLPFPIPRNGSEAMWNHTLRWRGESTLYEFKGYQMTADGRWINVIDSINNITMPYYYKEGDADKAAEYWMARSMYVGPPLRAGEGIVGRLQLDESKTQSWIYLAGQRRVRKLPNTCCDTPTPFSAGVSSFDEVDNFLGRQDRFDWKLIGKQEMYIPYNSNRTVNAKSDDEVKGVRHLNPDAVRWELHRVWVVEATLRAGQRHTSPRSRYYLDEDTWTSVLSDRWDANGQLARHGFALPVAMPDIPATAGLTWGVYDLISNTVFVNLMFGDKPTSYRMVPRQRDSLYSPEAMAGEGVR